MGNDILSSDDEQSVVIYSYMSELRHPLALFRSMWSDLLASRDLAKSLMIRNIMAQYRESLLGYFWIFFTPIATAVGLTLASRAQIVNLGETELPYPAYVMFSMSLWQTFSESFNGPIQATTQAMPIMTKINFPREAVIMGRAGETCFRFCIKLIFIIGLFIWFRMPVTWSALLAPLGVINLIIFGTFIGCLLAPIAALYKDIVKILPPITGAWFAATPVIYSVPTDGVFGFIVKLNPVTSLLVTTRELATTGELTQIPAFWLASSVGVIGLLIAWVFYRVALPYAVERMSS